MSSHKVAVIDYGMGNLHSVASALNKVAPDVDVMITSDLAQIRDAQRIIFPGVGAIRDCVAEIKRLGFDQAVKQAIGEGKPVLGICVGMQSLLSFSEENGGAPCLDILPGQVRFFSGNDAFLRTRDESSDSGERLKVPHMGWNQVTQTIAHPLWEKIPDNSRFYFVHSYYAELEQEQWQAGRSHYGLNFTSAIAKQNLFAVQFHPEKSHTHGLQLLQNFVHWDGKIV